MSAVACILNLDRQPVSDAKLEGMAIAMKSRGPDGIGLVSRDMFGLVHCALHTTPQSLEEKQPVTENESGVLLAADARLDNRDDLALKLGIPGKERNTLPDSTLILLAYQKWGEGCFEKFVGDFAVIIWDARERKLLSARDAIGVKQLFFHKSGNQLLVATTIGAILAALPHPPGLNERFLKQLLRDQYHLWRNETVYQGIFPVGPGGILVAGETIEQKSFISLDPPQKFHYQDDDEYLEHFRELFLEVVTAHARSTTPVGIQVSGGIDSSGVAAALKHLDELSDPPAQNRYLYSVVTDTFPRMDEREYLESLAERCKPWPVHTLLGEESWPLRRNHGGELSPRDQPWTGLLWTSARDLALMAKDDGCRVILTGNGGDELALSNPYRYPQLMFGLPAKDLAKEWKHFVRNARSGSTLSLFASVVSGYVRTNYSPATLNRLKKVRDSFAKPRENPIDWVTSETNPDVSENHQEHIYTGKTSSDGLVRRGFATGLFKALLNGQDTLGELAGMEIRHPYTDRRLIDFASGLPDRFFVNHGLGKRILRQAMSDFLPADIRSRSSGGICDEMVRFGWEKENVYIKHLLAQSKLAAFGWLDRNSLSDAWDRYWNGDDSLMWPLNTWLNTEIWLDVYDKR